MKIIGRRLLLILQNHYRDVASQYYCYTQNLVERGTVGTYFVCMASKAAHAYMYHVAAGGWGSSIHAHAVM